MAVDNQLCVLMWLITVIKGYQCVDFAQHFEPCIHGNTAVRSLITKVQLPIAEFLNHRSLHNLTHSTHTPSPPNTQQSSINACTLPTFHPSSPVSHHHLILEGSAYVGYPGHRLLFSRLWADGDCQSAAMKWWETWSVGFPQWTACTHNEVYMCM